MISPEFKQALDKYLYIRNKPYLLVDFPSPKHLEHVKQPHRFKVLLGGNRSGKTETTAIEVIWHLLGEHPFYEVPKPPVRWRIHVPEYRHIELVINEKFRKYIPEYLLRGGSWDTAYQKRKYAIYFANGSSVDFTTHRKSLTALEGASLDGIWIDEECPQPQYRTLLYRTIDRNGKVFISATPIHGLTYMYDELIKPFEEGNENYYVTYVSTYDNKYLTEEVIKAIEQSAAEEEKDIRLYGKIMNVSRRVFRFSPERHVRYFPFPTGHEFFAGLDWGFFHRTAIVYVAKYDNVFLVVDEYVAKGLNLDRVGETIENWCSENGVNVRRLRVVYDSALNRPLPNGRREIDLLRKFGFRLVPSAKNLPLSVATVNELFDEDRLVIHPNCKYLIEDLQKLYIRNNKIKEDDPAKDTCDALRYVIFFANSVNKEDYFDEEDEETIVPSSAEVIRDMILQRRYGRKTRIY